MTGFFSGNSDKVYLLAYHSIVVTIAAITSMKEMMNIWLVN